MKKTQMYTIPKFRRSTLIVNKSKEGESLETKVERMVHNKEPIKDGAPLLYTERSEGVRAGTNIRTDRFEVAVDAATKIQKSFQAKRDQTAKKKEEDGKTEMTITKGEDGKPESIHGKSAGS